MAEFEASGSKKLLDSGLHELEERGRKELESELAGKTDLESKLGDEENGLDEAMARYQLARQDLQKKADGYFASMLEAVRVGAALDEDGIRELEGEALADCFLFSGRELNQEMLWKLDYDELVRAEARWGGALGRISKTVDQEGRMALDRILSDYRSARNEILREEWRTRRTLRKQDVGVVKYVEREKGFSQAMKRAATAIRAYWQAMSQANEAIGLLLDASEDASASEVWKARFYHAVFPNFLKPRAVDEMLAEIDGEVSDLPIESRTEVADLKAEYKRKSLESELLAADALARVRMSEGAFIIRDELTPLQRTFVQKCLVIHRLSRATIDALLVVFPERKNTLEKIAFSKNSIPRWGPSVDTRAIARLGMQTEYDELPSRARRYIGLTTKK